MFKSMFLYMVIVASTSSAFPVESTTDSFLKTVINNHFEAKQKAADFVKSAVSKITGLGSDGVDVASAMSKAGTKQGIELGIKGTIEGITIGTQFTELTRQFTKHIPKVNRFIEAGTNTADMGMIAGLNASVLSLKTADDLSQKGIDLATGVAKTTLEVVDKSVATGATIFKDGMKMIKIE